MIAKIDWSGDAEMPKSWLMYCLLALAFSSNAFADEPKKIGTLLAAGDISWCPGKGATLARKTAELIRQIVKEATVPVRVLALGDLAYGSGKKEQLKCFAENWSGFEDLLLPIPGNHEYQSLNAAPFFAAFANNNFVHQNDQPSKKGTDKRWDKKGYFSLNFPNSNGPWRIIGMNDNLQNLHGSDMANENAWLEKQLDLAGPGNDQRCVLAFWHAPLYSSGQHGHVNYATPRANAVLENLTSMKRSFGILFSHGGSIVLAGHDHDYEQFAPQDENSQRKGNGIRSFVVGTGGATLTKDDYVNLAPNSEGGPFGHTKGVQGILKIDLYEDRYTWDFMEIDKQKNIPQMTNSALCNDRK
ncbi:Calcineurin-like phosphoesterase family protein [Mesorhizobium loti]|nr:Calcineurin-like phosphoesterase family protein [Mesorhizobium loti]